MIRFANAKNSGVANISSITVPCIVNSWLYCSGDRNCMLRPGQLGPHQHGHQAAGDEEDERRRQVHQTDGLVVGRPQQVGQPRALDRDVRRARPAHDRLRCDRGHDGAPGRHRAVVSWMASTMQDMGGPRGSSRTHCGARSRHAARNGERPGHRRASSRAGEPARLRNRCPVGRASGVAGQPVAPRRRRPADQPDARPRDVQPVGPGGTAPGATRGSAGQLGGVRRAAVRLRVRGQLDVGRSGRLLVASRPCLDQPWPAGTAGR